MSGSADTLSDPDRAARQIGATCAIAGGGPAGMMLGLLLARAGIDVVVLEKHADFLRDFRGDTLHPSTLQVMHELGLLDGFLALPHQKMRHIGGIVGDTEVQIADFTHLPVVAPYIALMPQWDFLDFLAREAVRFPNFRLIRNAEAKGLIEEGGRVTGIRAATKDGPLELRADLTVAADGRRSALREASGLRVDVLGAPMDVFWFRLSHTGADPSETLGQFTAGQILVRIFRGDYFQCGYVIAKGAAERIKAEGIEAFRERIARLLGEDRDLSDDLKSWDDVSLLTVAVDRLPKWWRPGFLAIGDAAHAMSPVGGVGINLAIQDAVASANLLFEPLREGRLADNDLEAVQARRLFPAKVTQAVQVFVQNNVIANVLETDSPVEPPLPVRLLQRFPVLRRIPARAVGMGVRPEHVAEALREIRGGHDG